MDIEEVIKYLKTLDARELYRVFDELSNDKTTAFWEAISEWR